MQQLFYARLAHPLRRLAMVAGVLSVAGCQAIQNAPTAPERMAQMIGLSERDVIRSWGPPDGFYEYTDGARSLTWENSYWNETWQETWHCEIILELDSSGIIVDGSLSHPNGTANACHAIMDGNT